MKTLRVLAAMALLAACGHGHGAASLQPSGTPIVHLVGTTRFHGWGSFDMYPQQLTDVFFYATGESATGPATGPDAIPVTKVVIAVPTGGALTVSGLHLPRTCHGPTLGAFTQRLPEATYAPWPLTGAKFYLQLPPSTHAGATLDYRVTIANPTGKSIPMTPCPAYLESLSTGTPGKDIFGLNCAGHTKLEPHERLTFAMQLPVPADAPTGMAKVEWTLEGVFPLTREAISVVGNDNPCQAADLTASAGRPQSFDKTGFYGVKDRGTAVAVTVTNHSATPCTLQGPPTFQLTAHDGHALGLSMAKGPRALGPIYRPPAQVRRVPDGSARTTLTWHTRWCGSDPNPVSVALRLPSNGDRLNVVPADGWTPPPCTGFAWNDLSADDFGPA